MAPPRKKSKKGVVAKKSSKTKHSSATAAATKETRRRVPRSVTPTPLSVDMSQVLVVGGLCPRRFDWNAWNLASHLERVLKGRLAATPNKHFYVHLTFETLVEGTKSTLVPVAVVIECDCVPTTLLAVTSVQSEAETIMSFDNVNARWAPIHDRVSILKSQDAMDASTREYLILYSQRPSEIEEEQVVPVNTVSIMFNERVIVWDVELDENLDEYLEEDEDFVDDTVEDKEEIKQLLRQEHQMKIELRRQDLLNKKALFADMMEREQLPAESLEGRRVFKVYPQDARLEPVMTVFGLSGFIKSRMVNRYIGNADEVF